VDGTGLRQALVQHFNEEELRTLCFDLGVDYDSLSGKGKEAKARELVSRLERRGELDKLIAACHHRRPNAHWAKEVPAGATSRLLMSTVGRLEVRMDRMESDMDRLRVISTATLTAVILSIGGAIVALFIGG